jgi:hypothetical protein
MAKIEIELLEKGKYLALVDGKFTEVELTGEVDINVKDGKVNYVLYESTEPQDGYKSLKKSFYDSQLFRDKMDVITKLGIDKLP